MRDKIITERLVLRKLKREDALLMFENFKKYND